MKAKQVHILPASSINRSKWDQCIQQANNGLIYSTTLYLDALANNWHGLVLADYDAVMPLPWRKKMGMRYCYTPAFTQQLGISGTYSLDECSTIINVIKEFAWYGDFQFNYGNDRIAEYLSVEKRTNLVIDLSKGYEKVAGRYQKDMSDAATNELAYQNASYQQGIDMYCALYGERIPQVSPADYMHLQHLFNTLSSTGDCIARSVTDTSGEVLSITVLLKYKNRLYNIINATGKTGRIKKSNYFLYDQLIREFAGKIDCLDLEGSGILGIKLFYEKMGAVDQPYFYYHQNRLRSLLGLGKR